MPASLDKLPTLPGSNRVYCEHEYTLSNLKFARPAEPNNNALIHSLRRCPELRAQNLPTLPSTIEQEKRINPFLGTRRPGVAQAASAHEGATQQDDVAVFDTLRQWKNEFK